jgi:hypothetical protein
MDTVHHFLYEELYILGYNTCSSVKVKYISKENINSSSGSKSKVN